MNDIGIGLIGSGFMGKCHALAFRAVEAVFPHVPRPRLAVLADSTLEKAQASARQFGFARATDDWRNLVEDPGVDVVSVTTPNALHHEMSMAAIAAGKHVYCEKPLGVTLRQAEEMAAAAERAGVRTLVGYNYLKNPAALHAKALIAGGSIGRIIHFRGIFDEDYMADPNQPGTWRSLRGEAGLGVLGDMGCHLVAAALDLAGPVGKRARRDPHRLFTRLPGGGVDRRFRRREADRERGHRDPPWCDSGMVATDRSRCRVPPGGARTGSHGRFTATRACCASTRSA